MDAAVSGVSAGQCLGQTSVIRKLDLWVDIPAGRILASCDGVDTSHVFCCLESRVGKNHDFSNKSNKSDVFD